MISILKKILAIADRPRRSGETSHRVAALVICLVFACGIAASSPAFADAPGETQCTSDSAYNPVTAPTGQGLISGIVSLVETIMSGVSSGMYEDITGAGTFRETISAAISLYVLLYGVLFMIGVAQMSLYDFAIRMIKIAIVVMVFEGWGDVDSITNPDGSVSFAGTIYSFFHNGMNEIICDITGITVSNFTAAGDFCTQDAHGNVNPFGGLDVLITQVLSARTFLTLSATFTTTPYGFLFGSIFFLAIFYFIQALLTAIWVYLMAIIVQTLLFGLAPIFFAACCSSVPSICSRAGSTSWSTRCCSPS